MILEPLLLALVAGFFGSLVGLGGGIVLVPALALGLGLPITVAIPAAQVAVVGTALGGTGRYIREGHGDIILAIRAASVTVLGAVIGARVGVLIPPHALELGFAALIFVVSANMMRKSADVEVEGPPRTVRAGLLFLAGGLLAGMLGVGGGILNVPAIRLYLKRSMVMAVATSAMIVAFTGAAGAAVYAHAGHMDWRLATACTTGAFTGGHLGARVGSRLKRTTLQWIFLVVILYVGVEMTVRGLSLPWWR
jgi:uncharacterized membrane protein YfcA